jgi:hypothetical protein
VLVFNVESDIILPLSPHSLPACLPCSGAQEKEEVLQREVRTCKADVLDFMNRARKIAVDNAESDENAKAETQRITKLVANLAQKFAEEESARVGRNVLEDAGDDEMSPGKKKAAEQVELAPACALIPRPRPAHELPPCPCRAGACTVFPRVCCVFSRWRHIPEIPRWSPVCQYGRHVLCARQSGGGGW